MSRDRIRALDQKIENLSFLRSALVQYHCAMSFYDNTLAQYPCAMSFYDDALVRYPLTIMPLYDVFVQLYACAMLLCGAPVCLQYPCAVPLCCVFVLCLCALSLCYAFVLCLPLWGPCMMTFCVTMALCDGLERWP